MRLPRLIDERGKVQVGYFEEAVEEINYHDFDLRTPFGKKAGAVRRYFDFHQFYYAGILSESIVVGCAIADIRYVSSMFVYLYDPQSNAIESYSFLQPLSRQTAFSLQPEHGRISFNKGSHRVQAQCDEVERKRSLSIQLGEHVDLNVEIDEKNPDLRPLRICTRAGATGWVFTRKAPGSAVTGTLRWKHRTFDLSAIHALACQDWSAGYMRHDTFWNWGCLATVLKDGQTIGLNVSCGVNETSFTENFVWIDGQKHRIGLVHFVYDEQNLFEIWALRSDDSRLQLTFTPEAKHAENTNAIIVAANFSQMVGRFSGEIHIEGQREIVLNGTLGYAEHHFSRW